MQTLVIQPLFEIFELSKTHLNKPIQVESVIFLGKTGMAPSDYRIKYCKTQQYSSSVDNALYVNR
ncbi:hypothetical protein [uncultured Metabacillus sp.]|uniref:hypothetical protein n=1 Tax=uncultured Metabacillus sp. TaxID=2860135 RepID=UPI00260B0241|nr:hypothetical protein [uncultured Metabacillus sp.]